MNPRKEAAPGLTIGALARAAGVPVETVRYYQRIGLIEEPPRPTRGYRRYPEAAVGRIRFIKRAQRLGFTLREIGELLTFDSRGCEEARRIAEARQAEIQRRIADLNAMHKALERLIEGCRRPGARHGGCAIIDTLRRRD